MNGWEWLRWGQSHASFCTKDLSVYNECEEQNVSVFQMSVHCYYGRGLKEKTTILMIIVIRWSKTTRKENRILCYGFIQRCHERLVNSRQALLEKFRYFDPSESSSGSSRTVAIQDLVRNEWRAFTQDINKSSRVSGSCTRVVGGQFKFR